MFHTHLLERVKKIYNTARIAGKREKRNLQVSWAVQLLVNPEINLLKQAVFLHNTIKILPVYITGCQHLV